MVPISSSRNRDRGLGVAHGAAPVHAHVGVNEGMKRIVSLPLLYLPARSTISSRETGQI